MSYLDQVIEVAQHVPVFPCRATTIVDANGRELKRKRPHITKFKDRASQEPDQIRSWWKRWPNALVGMPTGTPSGIFAIDFDAVNGQTPWEMMGELPGEVDEFGLMQETKRGVHLLYRVDPERPLRNGTNVFGEHIDTRGEGGYLCIAPSSGYKFIGGFEDLAPVPEWVYTFLRNRVKTTRAKKTGEEVQEAEHVIKTLKVLDPKRYRSYEDWVKIMLACYHGSNADESVKSAFKEWSALDPDSYDEYTDQQIDAQWEAAGTDIDNIVTYKTLRREVTKHHGAMVVDSENPFNNFGDIDQGEEEVQAVQASVRLDANSRGKVESSPSNLRKLLTAEGLMGKANALKGVFKYNEMSQRVEFKSEPPWPWSRPLINEHFDDLQLTNLSVYLSGMYKVSFYTNDLLRGVVNAGAEEESYHPVRSYLNSLKWDKKKRLHKWLPSIVKTDDTPYNREIGRRFLISAVARAMDPGSQVDTMPVFEGDQGIYKTSMVKVLGGDWYRAPNLRDLSGKESLINCLGAWFIEVEEMGAIKSNQIEFIKKFITTRNDAIRFAYDKFTSDVPRSFVLIGTMNPSGDNQYIHDVTGARRFWPIECTKHIELNKLADERDQLFAEATHEYKSKMPWWFTEKEDKELMITQVQRLRQSEDPWFETIKDYLYYGEARSWHTVTPSDIWTGPLQGHKTLTNNREANRIKRIMINSLGWVYRSSAIDPDGKRGQSRRRYCRPQWELDLEKGEL